MKNMGLCLYTGLNYMRLLLDNLPFFNCVDGINDVFLSQFFNNFSIVFPDLQDAALQTLVVQRVDKIAVDLRRLKTE